MTAHKHVMILDRGDDGRWWFWCEVCPARVEIVPTVQDVNTIVSSARVRCEGEGGFTAIELAALAWDWVQHFRAYVDGCRPRPVPRRRRRRPG